MVRCSFKKSCNVSLSPDKLRHLLLSSQPIQQKTSPPVCWWPAHRGISLPTSPRLGSLSSWSATSPRHSCPQTEEARFCAWTELNKYLRFKLYASYCFKIWSAPCPRYLSLPQAPRQIHQNPGVFFLALGVQVYSSWLDWTETSLLKVRSLPSLLITLRSFQWVECCCQQKKVSIRICVDPGCEIF